MERKEWLETFLDLLDRKRPTIDYRRKLRIKLRDLNPHVTPKRVEKYRKELADIIAAEEAEAAEAAKPAEPTKVSSSIDMTVDDVEETEYDMAQRGRPYEFDAKTLEKLDSLPKPPVDDYEGIDELYRAPDDVVEEDEEL